jgi:hypothetical protein
LARSPPNEYASDRRRCRFRFLSIPYCGKDRHSAKRLQPAIHTYFPRYDRVGSPTRTPEEPEEIAYGHTQ